MRSIFMALVAVGLAISSGNEAQAGGHGNQQIVLKVEQKQRQRPIVNAVKNLIALPFNIARDVRQEAQLRQALREQQRQQRQQLKQLKYSQNLQLNLQGYSQNFSAPIVQRYGQAFAIEQIDDCQAFYAQPIIVAPVKYKQTQRLRVVVEQQQVDHNCQSFFQGGY